MKKYLGLLFVFLFLSTPIIAKNNNDKQVQNKNEIKNEEVEESVEKISTQVQKLLDTVEEKSDIGQKVKEIAQTQQKTQEKIKSTYYELKNRGQFVRLFVGSDKKKIEALEQMSGENKLLIENLEKLKAETLNQAEKDQLQLTIDSMVKQNTSLENELNNEKKVNGLFGWFVKLFNRK